jgi:hypothetical protein
VLGVAIAEARLSLADLNELLALRAASLQAGFICGLCGGLVRQRRPQANDKTGSQQDFDHHTPMYQWRDPGPRKVLFATLLNLLDTNKIAGGPARSQTQTLTIQFDAAS